MTLFGILNEYLYINVLGENDVDSDCVPFYQGFSSVNTVIYEQKVLMNKLIR